MEPEKTPRERAEDLISLLVSDWRPSRGQVLWTIRIALGLVVLQAPFVLIGIWLWEVIADYVQPRACYELGRKPRRNADSTNALIPLRSPFPHS
jgi:hypothetical protein